MVTGAKIAGIACMTLSAGLAQAQSMTEPSPIQKLTEIHQFGVPRDAKYIFCDSGECPERTAKHLHIPSPKPPVVMPAPQTIQPPFITEAKEVPTKQKATPHKPKPKRKKRPAKVACAPEK